jgi:hypothetical protein
LEQQQEQQVQSVLQQLELVQEFQQLVLGLQQLEQPLVLARMR